MSDISYEIVETVGILSENSSGWRKELNKVSWNNGRVPEISFTGLGAGIMPRWAKESPCLMMK